MATRAELAQQRAQANAERLAQRAAKEAERAKRLADTAVEQKLCLELCRTPPREFQGWGVMRTRAWIKAAQRCRALARRNRPKLERLQELRARLEEVPSMPISGCVEVAQAKR